jgi:hypothetical protein
MHPVNIGRCFSAVSPRSKRGGRPTHGNHSGSGRQEASIAASGRADQNAFVSWTASNREVR